VYCLLYLIEPLEEEMSIEGRTLAVELLQVTQCIALISALHLWWDFYSPAAQHQKAFWTCEDFAMQWQFYEDSNIGYEKIYYGWSIHWLQTFRTKF